MAGTSPTRKRIAILIVVVGSALIGERLLALAAADTEGAEPLASKRAGRSRSAEAAASAPSLRLDRLDARQRALSESTDPPGPSPSRPALFDSVSWQAPVAKAASSPPPPPPKPVAPPFPYAYMGGLTEDGIRTVFLTQGERVIAVKVGDTVDAAYRIDQMTEKQMKLTYLPLDETLVLALGGGR